MNEKKHANEQDDTKDERHHQWLTDAAVGAHNLLACDG